MCFSRNMNRKQLIPALIGLLLAGAAPSWAVTGGPWDHLTADTFSNANADGLYEATVTMKNGNGFVRFTQNKDNETLEQIDFANLERLVQLQSSSGVALPTSVLGSTLAAQSNSVIFFEGNAYFGNTYGIVNLASGTVTGVGSGQSSIVDQIQQTATTAATNLNAIVDITGLSETMSLNFVGKVTDRFPQLRFSAKGEVNFFSKPGITLVAGPGGTPVIRVQGGGTTTTSVVDNRVITTNAGLTTTLPFGPTADNTSGTITNTNTNVGTQTINSNSQTSKVNGAALKPDNKTSIRLFGGRVSRTAQIRVTQQAATGP